MICSACGFESPKGFKFCGSCAAPLRPSGACPSCGFENPPGFKFCGECGGSIAVGAAKVTEKERPLRDALAYTPKHLAEKILQSKSALEGERKQVTVLFADVKGSMELAEQTGPEKWHAILDRFFQILADGVHRFEGTVNQYTGDGIMALFGAPIAHEDHAQRACYAALHLRDALRGYADELRRTEGLSLAARIGLNSGEVVVGRIGDDLRMDYTAQGHTVGLAQRMEQRAAPDSTYLTEHTARLVEGYFALRDLGEFDLKGASAPLRVYELQGLGSARTRLDRSRARGFAKFVGRERETATLESALEEVLAGSGQVVGVVAEAGTGKSRLCAEFVARCRAGGLRVNEAHCPAHGRTVLYLPLLELLRDFFEIGERDSDHEARRKIAGELMLLDEKFQALLPLVFEFLGVGDPARPAPPMSPEARQQQLFAFVRHLAEARSAREPAVLLLDDLHWIDPGSDEFLAHAVDAAANTRTLWLVNFRPEYHAEWMSRSWYRQLPLRPLGPEATDELLADLIGRDLSVAALPARIHERTGGNPFFIEEVVQSLVESGSLGGSRGAYRLAAPLEALEIPGTVQSVLAARIDRLTEREKRLLQTAAVIGKEFTAPLLLRVAELSESDLAASLSTLVRAEFVLEKALYPEAEYAFKHPLTQEVALHSQLAARRAGLHAAVARALETLDAERLDERAALLAYHWEEAGDAPTAARWHSRAARVAGLDSAREGMRHWQRVWELLRPGPESTESRALRSRAAVEILKLAVRVGLGQDRVEAIFAEAKALAVEAGDARAQVSLGYSFGLTYMLGGTPRRAVSIFEEAVAVADRTGDPELRYAAREPLAPLLCYLGDLERALRVNDEVLEITRDDPTLGAELLSFSAAFSFSHRGLILGELGRFGEAAECFARCDEGAERFGDREMQSWNHSSRARTLARAGNTQAALSASRRAEEGAEKVGSPLGLITAYANHGVALRLAGEPREARDRLLRALEIARANRVMLSWEADYLAALAEAQLAAGDGEAARTTADEAVRVAERLGTRTYELHAHLARARVLLSLDGAGATEEIEATLERASALVRATGARSYEPEILEARARLAGALSDAAACERQLREAERLYAELGATGHAERLARELAANT